jgi:glycosyltransferase involved in cell wall biosynthesis
MRKDRQVEGKLKTLTRSTYRNAIGTHVLLTAPLRWKGLPRVYYAGARSGDLGGTLVKVKRLQEHFPQDHYLYNLVYALSNSPYLPQTALDWLSRCKVPIVLNQNGIFYPGWYAGDWQEQNRLMSIAYHRADHVFWQSNFCRRCADHFLGDRNGPGEVLFNAIDICHFAPPLELTTRPFTFLITGKIGTHLGYRLKSTIEGLAAARLNGLNARLIIAGWIEDATGAKAMAIQCGIADYVKFLGSYRQDEAPKIYHMADAYVMTKYLDPCPNTVLEAMACGLPILYSASGGVPELVGPDAGVALPVTEDWQQIHVPSAEAIAEGMISIAAYAKEYSLAARERAVKKFDIRNWIERHRIVFESLLT